MAFEDRGYLFVTGFSTHKVYDFDSSGGLVGICSPPWTATKNLRELDIGTETVFQ